MATIKLKFRPSSTGGKKGILYYQIIHNRKVRQVKSAYRIYPEEWNEAESTVVEADGTSGRDRLQMIRDNVGWEMERMRDMIRMKDRDGDEYTADELAREMGRLKPCQSVFRFMAAQAERLNKMGRQGTAKTYTSTLNSFRRFRQNADMSFLSVNADTVERYEAWMLDCGLVRNTTSFYLRTLRTVYNQAVEQGLTADRNAFRRVYTGFDKTSKRAVLLDTVRKIKRLDLSAFPKLDFARDMFLFSFYMRGMPFVDIAFLKKKNLKDGMVKYQRRKTKQTLCIEWEKQMQTIINKYKQKTIGTEYLLPIITTGGGSERHQYRMAQQRVNRALKKISRMIGLSVPITMYVARHSWASAAYRMKIPLAVISEGMGHDSEKTTQIYLASLDSSQIDKANKRILNRV